MTVLIISLISDAALNPVSSSVCGEAYNVLPLWFRGVMLVDRRQPLFFRPKPSSTTNPKRTSWIKLANYKRTFEWNQGLVRLLRNWPTMFCNFFKKYQNTKHKTSLVMVGFDMYRHPTTRVFWNSSRRGLSIPCVLCLGTILLQNTRHKTQLANF